MTCIWFSRSAGWLIPLALGLASNCFGTGYDFTRCKLSYQELSGSTEAINRKQRLVAIRENEEKVVQPFALRLSDLRKAYNTQLKKNVSKVTPQNQANFIKELKLEQKDLDEDPQLKGSDLTPMKLIQALERKPRVDSEVMQALQNYTFESALLNQDTDGNILVLMTRKNTGLDLASNLPPVGKKPETGPVARNLMNAYVTVFALSEIRLAFFKNLAAETPLQNKISDAVTDGTAKAVFRREFGQKVFETFDSTAKKPITPGEARVRDRLTGDQHFLQGQDREDLLLRTANAIAKKRLPRFFQEELERHYQFINDFQLPIDPLSQQHFRVLSLTAETLPPNEASK